MELTLIKHQVRATAGGAIAGCAGGIGMVALPVIRSLARDGDPWAHLKLAAAVYLGNGALREGFDPLPILLGLTLHLMIAQAWGLVFGVSAYGLSRVLTLGSGMLLGLVSYGVMVLLLLPVCGMGELGRSIASGGGLSLHLCFGFFTALCFLAFQRQLDPDTLRRLMEQARGRRR
ncbi:MAG: hypothetical protein HYZ28_01295 [Myxococcales bacterium]|nr:hypothetical protein [Myxococcales bacterium]